MYLVLEGGVHSTVQVAGPGSYRLAFWSVDESGTVEPAHVAKLTVVATPSAKGLPSTPSSPSSVKHKRSFTVSGYIRRHKSGTSPVTLGFYRYQSGRWVLRKSTTARVSNVLTFSKYSRATSLPLAGRWRVRASCKVGRRTLRSAYSLIQVR